MSAPLDLSFADFGRYGNKRRPAVPATPGGHTSTRTGCCPVLLSASPVRGFPRCGHRVFVADVCVCLRQCQMGRPRGVCAGHTSVQTCNEPGGPGCSAGAAAVGGTPCRAAHRRRRQGEQGRHRQCGRHRPSETAGEGQDSPSGCAKQSGGDDAAARWTWSDCAAQAGGVWQRQVTGERHDARNAAGTCVAATRQEQPPPAATGHAEREAGKTHGPCRCQTRACKRCRPWRG